MSLSRALDGLDSALDRLENSIEAMADDRERRPSDRDEVRRLVLDRADLAGKLDRSEDRAQRLAETNREVSRRLIGAMETIRRVVGA